MSETIVRVDLATTARVTMPIPDRALVLPMLLPPGVALEDVELHDVEARDGESATGETSWVPWTGFDVGRGKDTIELSRLPSKTVRCRLVAPGFREVWTPLVDLSLRTRSIAAPVRFTAGRAIRVTLIAPEGREPPEEPSFRVFTPPPDQRALRFATTRAGEGTWSLSAFAPGVYELYIDAGDRFCSCRGSVTVGDEDDAGVSFELRLAEP